MNLFYIDESGNTGRDLDSVEQPVHWLVGVESTPCLRSNGSAINSFAPSLQETALSTAC